MRLNVNKAISRCKIATLNRWQLFITSYTHFQFTIVCLYLLSLRCRHYCSLKKFIGINYLHENSLPCLPSLHFVRSCHARFHLQVVYMWKVVHVICMTLLLSWIGLFSALSWTGSFTVGMKQLILPVFCVKSVLT